MCFVCACTMCLIHRFIPLTPYGLFLSDLLYEDTSQRTDWTEKAHIRSNAFFPLNALLIVEWKTLQSFVLGAHLSPSSSPDGHSILNTLSPANRSLPSPLWPPPALDTIEYHVPSKPNSLTRRYHGTLLVGSRAHMCHADTSILPLSVHIFVVS